MPWGQFITQWLHVFFAICWFGGVLFLLVVVGPALQSSDPVAAGQIGEAIGRRTQRFLAPAGALTILLGLLRVTVFGPIRSWSFFDGSAYGMTAIAALVLAMVIAIFGGITGKIGASLGNAPPPERPAMLKRITLLASLSVVGFLLALTCMILMRYGM
jgi:uncharacterized membrane protein